MSHLQNKLYTSKHGDCLSSPDVLGNIQKDFVVVPIDRATAGNIALVCERFYASFHTKTVYIFCIQKLYKIYTTDVYKMYTKCIQNVYHISTNFCIHFVYKIKRTMAAKFCIQNVYKSLPKCGIHFLYILYTSILIYKKCTSKKLCIELVYQIHTECIYK